MGIYLGSMPIYGIDQNGLVKEVFVGTSRKYIRRYNDLQPGTLRIQFSDTSYDPTQASFNGSTLADYGWTLTKLSSEPNLWDFYHPANLPNNALRPLASGQSGVSGAPTAGYMVTEALCSSNWSNEIGLFSDHTYLTYATEFTIPTTTSAAAYMFNNCTRLSNDVEWARRIAATITLMTEGESPSQGNYITNTPHASSIPVPFGGTKTRTRVVSKTGAGPFFETFDIAFRPGDWCYIAARGYTGSDKSYAYITARTSGSTMTTSRQDSSSRIMTVTATGSTGNKAVGDFTVRWGYGLTSVMTCGSSKRQAYANNNPYANVYRDSYNFY